MLLDHHPAKTAILQRPHELVCNIRMIWQSHLRGRKTAHATERVEAENRREMMLPGPHMQPKILRRGGRRHRVPPCRPEPLDRAAIRWIERNPLQIVEDVVEPHRPETMEKRARVVQHHPGLFSLPSTVG